MSSLQVADFVANETMKDVGAKRFKNSESFGPKLRSLCDDDFLLIR
jgi:hypothetical protein